jgi:hypothetical protein
MEVSMAEAAQLLDLSIDTVRRRLHRGELQGRQEPTAQGFRWWVEVPDIFDPGYEFGTAIPGQNGSHSGATLEDASGATSNEPGSTLAGPGELQALHKVIDVLQAQVKAQQEQLGAKDQHLEAKDRQIEQLRVLLQQAQVALPAQREHRPWWRFWRR